MKCKMHMELGKLRPFVAVYMVGVAALVINLLLIAREMPQGFLAWTPNFAFDAAMFVVHTVAWLPYSGAD